MDVLGFIEIFAKSVYAIKMIYYTYVLQEAELRRISDQQKNVAANRNWQQPRHEKHLPDSIIQSLTQRVQNRTNINERNQHNRRYSLNNLSNILI